MVRRQYRDPEERLEHAIDAFYQGRVEVARSELKDLEAVGYRCAELYLFLGHCELARERIRAALRHYREARFRGPDQPEVYIGLAVVAARRLHFGRAIRLLRRAIKLRPDLPEAFDNLILCHAARGEHEAAADAFQASIQIDPASPHPYFNAGFVYFDSGDAARARKLWRKVVELEPEYPDAARLVASCDRVLGELEGARRRLEKLKRRRPRNVEVLAELGMVHEERDEWQSAIREYIAALEVDPGQARVRARLGILMYRNGSQAEGVDHLSRAALEAPTDPDVVEPYAYTLIEAGRPFVATRAMRDPIRADRRSADARAARARVASMCRRWSRAAADYAHAARLDPDIARHRKDCAEALIHAGALERAERVVIETLQRFGPDVDLYDLWARLAAGRGDVVAATQRLRAGLAALPGEPRLTVRLADAYLDEGRASRAVVLARRVRMEHAWGAESADVMGRALLALGQPGRALDVATRLLEQHPDDPRGVALRGRAVLSTGDAARAIPDLRRYVRARPEDPDGYRWLAHGLEVIGEDDAARTQDRIRRFVEGKA